MVRGPDDRPMNTGTQAQPDPRSAAGSGRTGKTEDLGGYQAQVPPGEPGEEGEEAEAVAFAEAALGRVTSRLGDASRELDYIVKATDIEGDASPQFRAARDVLAQIQAVEATLMRIFKRRRKQESGDAFVVLAEYSALMSDAEAQLPGPGPGGGPPDSPPPWWRKHWDAIVANLKAAVPHLWAFLSRLFTPTQWTVEGNVATGIFGFAGASLSVTFGKGG